MRASGSNESLTAVVMDKSSKLSFNDDGEEHDERDEQAEYHLVVNEEAI